VLMTVSLLGARRHNSTKALTTRDAPRLPWKRRQVEGLPLAWFFVALALHLHN
jgi:hypothetical protein